MPTSCSGLLISLFSKNTEMAPKPRRELRSPVLGNAWTSEIDMEDRSLSLTMTVFLLSSSDIEASCFLVFHPPKRMSSVKSAGTTTRWKRYKILMLPYLIEQILGSRGSVEGASAGSVVSWAGGGGRGAPLLRMSRIFSMPSWMSDRQFFSMWPEIVEPSSQVSVT